MKYTLSIIALIIIAILGYTLFFSPTQSLTNERVAALNEVDGGELASIQDNKSPEAMGSEAIPASETGAMENDTTTVMNSGSQDTIMPEKMPEKQVVSVPKVANIKTALLANGCFWCAEHDLAAVTGVIDAVSGYAGGSSENPTYKNYIDGGHREIVLVTYDANVVSFANLVESVIKHGDPTDAEGSYFDRGQEYAPAIYYENDTERTAALEVIAKIDALTVFEKPISLVVIPRVKFWPAEEYHQDYAEKNPIRYNYYRTGSGRDTFIKKYWGDNADAFTVSNTITQTSTNKTMSTTATHPWESFVKPSEETLRKTLTALQYEVTQEEGTEKPFSNEYDKNYAEGIYVDIVSGEPLYLSKDKYDSGSGWPSFVKPISADVVVLKEDRKLFSTRTEVRSRYADSHLGHVFNDGPSDRGGLRYCMNSAALRFVAKADMEAEGYAYLFPLMNQS